MDNISLRIADSSDFSSLKELMLNALQTDPTAFSVSHSEYAEKENFWWHEYLDPFLYGDMQQMLFVEEQDKLIGCSGIIFESRERKKHTATLVWFYILPEYRGRGYGKVLLEAILELAQERKLKKISLMANMEQGAAINLYKKYGFEICGTLKHELKIDEKFYDVVLMELLLV